MLFRRCFNVGHWRCINVVERWKSDVGFCFIFKVSYPYFIFYLLSFTFCYFPSSFFYFPSQVFYFLSPFFLLPFILFVTSLHHFFASLQTFFTSFHHFLLPFTVFYFPSAYFFTFPHRFLYFSFFVLLASPPSSPPLLRFYFPSVFLNYPFEICLKETLKFCALYKHAVWARLEQIRNAIAKFRNSFDVSERNVFKERSIIFCFSKSCLHGCYLLCSMFWLI